MATIRIDSILGGHSATTNFAGKDQFRASLAIDPAFSIDDSDSPPSSISRGASGLIRPAPIKNLGNTNSGPVWIVPNPKDSLTYIYDFSGSAFTLNSNITTLTGLSDAGGLSASTGNGCAYYDNYIYFAKNTTVARYGPLDGTPTLNPSYWDITLAKAALTNTTYPTYYGTRYPNHPMYRHSDGKLYFGDVVNNQGTIHYISTTKTTVEGDTDNGSTFGKLTFGYGLYPMAIEGYGSSLAIALVEAKIDNSGTTRKRDMTAKLAFWDTTSANFNSILWVEFPDQIITGLKNINGTLYIASDNILGTGFRISRYVGGSTIEEVAFFETGVSPLTSGLDGNARRLLVGSGTVVPEQQTADVSGNVYTPCVWSIGLQKNSLGTGIFNTLRASKTDASALVTAVALLRSGTGFQFYSPVVGWTTGFAGTSNNGIDARSSTTHDYSVAPAVWWSQMYKIGNPFQIKRIRIPLAQAVSTNTIITPKIYFDDGTRSQVLTVINVTNFKNGEVVANIKTAGSGSNILMGQNNFWLELRWTGAALATVGLPILIDFVIIPD